MTEQDLSIDTFLKEFKATLSDGDSQSMLRRINAERLLHLTAESLDDSMPGTRVRFLPDKRIAGAAGADFLYQIDDYDIRLQLLDAPDGQSKLDLDQLAEYQRLLEDNPNTVALVLIWATDELLAIPLSVRRIRYLREHPERLPNLLKQVQPLETVLLEIVQVQIKNWDVPFESSTRTEQEKGDLRHSFESSLFKAMEVVSGRPYRIPARKAASQNYPFREEQSAIMNVLDLALRGVYGDALVDLLTDIPPRAEPRSR